MFDLKIKCVFASLSNIKRNVNNIIQFISYFRKTRVYESTGIFPASDYTRIIIDNFMLILKLPLLKLSAVFWPSNRVKVKGLRTRRVFLA